MQKANRNKFKNLYVGQYSNFEKYKVDEYNNKDIIVNPTDKQRLEYFIKQEGSYYNSLVTGFSPLIRNSKPQIKLIKEKYLQLYLTVARIGFKLTPCMYNDIKLPKELEHFSDIIYGKIGDKRILTPDITLIIDVVTAPANIIPDTKEYMAKEVLLNVIEQIKIFETTVSGDTGEIFYKKPAEMLEPVDIYYRNTLQLSKDSINIYYSKKHNCSVIQSQYTTQPIVIENINLIENHNWNILFLKYYYNEDNTRNWVFSTRKVSSSYILRVSTIKKSR